MRVMSVWNFGMQQCKLFSVKLQTKRMNHHKFVKIIFKSIFYIILL